MQWADRFNAALFALGLLGSWLALRAPAGESGSQQIGGSQSPPEATAEAVSDAGGFRVERRAYCRILSLSTVSDGLLRELAEPDCVVGYTALAQRNPVSGYRYRGKPGLESASDIERVLALHPDLVIIASSGDVELARRLRRARLTVFDLGEQHGLATLLTSAESIAELIGQGERAERLIREWASRARAIAADISDSQKPRALYVAIYGDRLYGGTQGTSFADVLRLGGLVDAAADKFQGWPQYTAEQLLDLDPDVVVTARGMAVELCRHPGLERLKPCASQGRFVEVEDGLLNDPGLGLLDAAAFVRLAVHGEPR